MLRLDRCAVPLPLWSFFFFNDTATTEIYTLSLHDALPISTPTASPPTRRGSSGSTARWWRDRKSTRLNSSHGYISYAVFCFKKKKKTKKEKQRKHIPIQHNRHPRCPPHH